MEMRLIAARTADFTNQELQSKDEQIKVLTARLASAKEDAQNEILGKISGIVAEADSKKRKSGPPS